MYYERKTKHKISEVTNEHHQNRATIQWIEEQKQSKSAKLSNSILLTTKRKKRNNRDEELVYY